MALPILDLKRQYAGIRDEIRAALDRVLDAQAFVLGQEVRSFEENVESYLGKGVAVGCASGSDSLLLALMALDVGPGDEVITTPYSFFATVSCITRLGAKPVFADIDPLTYNVDLEQVARRITPHTKAFIPVHLFGQMAPLEHIAALCAEKGVTIVEDAAQAFGAWRRVGDEIIRAGVMGKIGCYSFFPTKNLGGYGDGGMVVTTDQKLAERLRKLRVHGAGATYMHDEIGLNSRLDAIQAAVLNVKLGHLEEWNEERRQIADRYRMYFAMRKLTDVITVPYELANNYHIYHQYVVRSQRRDELMAFLEQKGFSTRIYYPLPLHLQKCFAFLGCQKGDFPQSERLADEALALPIFGGLRAEEQEALADAVAAFYA